MTDNNSEEVMDVNEQGRSGHADDKKRKDEQCSQHGAGDACEHRDLQNTEQPRIDINPDNEEGATGGNEDSDTVFNFSSPSRLVPTDLTGTIDRIRQLTLASASPPTSPKLVPKTTPENAQIPPDTEEHVQHETEIVFKSFVHERYLEDHSPECNRDAIDDFGEFVPDLHDIDEELSQDTDSPTVLVGRQLARIGDEINHRYAETFRRMVRMLNLGPGSTENDAYEAFHGVARTLFKEGQVNWGRILSLLLFGYHLAVEMLRRHLSRFYGWIVRFVIRFIATEHISAWIAQQGGWSAALNYVLPDSLGGPQLAGIVGLACLALAVSWALNGGGSS